jgi:hypothetical protein
MNETEEMKELIAAAGPSESAIRDQLSRVPGRRIGLPTTCFAYPFACKGVAPKRFRPTPPSLQSGDEDGFTARYHDRVLVMG